MRSCLGSKGPECPSQWGKLDVQVEDGCPVLEPDVAMKLIHQIESKSTCAYVVVWVGGLEVWELMIL